MGGAEESSAQTLVTSVEQQLETAGQRRQRLLSVWVAHASMFLSGFGNSLIYIGMFPYIVSVRKPHRSDKNTYLDLGFCDYFFIMMTKTIDNY